MTETFMEEFKPKIIEKNKIEYGDAYQHLLQLLHYQDSDKKNKDLFFF